jgi:hypothetical protein
MAEASWGGEEAEAPPKKKGVPKWVWACGTGCLLMTVFGLVGVFFLAKAVKEGLDPDKQWAELAEVLPYDEPRPEYKIGGIPGMSLFPGIEGMWMLTEGGGTATMVMAFSGKEIAEAREEFFSAESGQLDFGRWTGNYGIHEFETGTVTIQGRELDCARYQSFPEPEPGSGEEEEEEETGDIEKAFQQAVLRVDVTPEDREGELLVIVQYTKNQSLEPVTDEEIRDFLGPFHIGPDR